MSLLAKDLKGVPHNIIIDTADELLVTVDIKYITEITTKSNLTKIPSLAWPKEFTVSRNITAVYKEINCNSYIGVTK